MPNGGRGANDETPAVDNEGVRVTDIISTLPLAKVASLSPTSEVLGTFDPVAASPKVRCAALAASTHPQLSGKVPYSLCNLPCVPQLRALCADPGRATRGRSGLRAAGAARRR